MIIKPTVGRVVWYRPNASDRAVMAAVSDQPLDAHVVAVWGDNCVNLVIFDANGEMFKRTSVRLLQELEAPDFDGQAYCEWMPYQIGQAKKHEVVGTDTKTE